MLSGRTQMPSNFWTLPEAPNLWKVHLVIWVDSGSYNGSTGKDKPLEKHEPWGRFSGHSPFRSWPTPGSIIIYPHKWNIDLITNEVYLAAVCCELSVKEEVHEVDLEEDVGEVEELASKEAESIEVVILPATSCQTLDCLFTAFELPDWIGRRYLLWAV